MPLTILKRNTNQARLLAEYAREFMKHGKPDIEVLERTKKFHTDSVLCGISALALRTNAPTVLKQEALSLAKKSSSSNRTVQGYTKCFGSSELVLDYKGIAANCSAVREWDSNGTVFGYRGDSKAHQAGEFGHNDFYPVVIAAAHQNKDINGATALRAMVLLDEIRGRLAECFALKKYKIDHVVHGAIASLITYGVLLDASPEQIEHGIGMFVAHYIPFRAIRAGHQLSDSKGASAALSTEVAIMSLKRAMMGFVGPKDIFRNPEAIFRLFTGIKEYESPFDLMLGMEGNDFSIMGMHFKLGLYEHQSAGALQGLLNLIYSSRFVEHNQSDNIQKIKITIYEPAYGIICDPHKRTPSTRQSADHSMLYILSTLLRKAIEHPSLYADVKTTDDLWKKLMLLPEDYSHAAVHNKLTHSLMEKIELEYGGKEYDDKYPDGIPTTITIKVANDKEVSSGLVMYPAGHARNKEANLNDILATKFGYLGNLALKEADAVKFIEKLNSIEGQSHKDLRNIYKCDIVYSRKSIDEAD